MEKNNTSRVSKNAKGYGYKYTDMASIHSWLDENGYRYFQEIIPEEKPNGEVIEYIWTTPIIDGVEKRAIRGCRVFSVALDRKSNVAQELGSGLTYARRYSLLMAFGLACEDDDAACLTRDKAEEKKPEKKVPQKQSQSKPQVEENPVPISKDHAQELETLIEWSATDLKSFLNYFKVSSIIAMTEADFDAAREMLDKKIAKQMKAEKELPEAMRG